MLASINGREPGNIFRHVVQAGLFVVELDNSRTWYRYHDLFGVCSTSAFIGSTPRK